jgi:hypothetical protein
MESVSVRLSQFAFLLVFKLKNANVSPVLCDVAVFADTFVGENHTHHIASLPSAGGLYWGGEAEGLLLRLNVIGRNYPLVSDLATFWFGPFRDIPSNWWNQTSETAFSGTDVGMSFSWQRISVPPSDFACLSVIFRSGNHYVDQPVLTDLVASSEWVPASGSFSVMFSVSDPVPGSDISIFLVVDQDIAGITLVEASAKEGSNRISIDSSAFPPGKRILWFYAVDKLGFVSSPVLLELLVVPASHTQPRPEPAAQGLSSGAIAGIAIGMAVLAIIVIVIITILARKRSKDRLLAKIDIEELTSQGELI